MPAEAAAYRDRITSAWGDVMVLGNADYYEKSEIVRNPAIADDLLIAASWYLPPRTSRTATPRSATAPSGRGSAACSTGVRAREPSPP